MLLKKSRCGYWGSTDRKSTKDKANISNPKVNRGCSPLTANHTSANCVQVSLGPSTKYILPRVYHTGGFNTIVSISAFPWLPCRQPHSRKEITDQQVLSFGDQLTRENLDIFYMLAEGFTGYCGQFLFHCLRLCQPDLVFCRVLRFNGASYPWPQMSWLFSSWRWRFWTVHTSHEQQPLPLVHSTNGFQVSSGGFD